MIKSIIINKAASFSENTEIQNLKEFNYIYGANGSGKTTISRVIDNIAQYKECRLNWKNDVELETKVFNIDFVKDNFQGELKGVFTLGEDHKNTIIEIEKINEDIKDRQTKITNSSIVLKGNDGNSGTQRELGDLNNSYLELFYEPVRNIKQGRSKLQEALRNSGLSNKSEFQTELFRQYPLNTAELKTKDELISFANKLYDPNFLPLNKISVPTFDKIIGYETSLILHKIIIGKEDVEISKIIEKLNNSDWVRDGRIYFDSNFGMCPFCQQKTPVGFESMLNEYFNEEYIADKNKVDLLLTSYENEQSQLLNCLDDIISNNVNPLLNIEQLSAHIETLKYVFLTNTQFIKSKQKELSKKIELETVKDIAQNIITIIDNSNKEIEKHNHIYNELSDQKKILKSQLFKYLIENQRKNIDEYITKKGILEKKIKGLTETIKNQKETIKLLQIEINKLENSITTIKPTCLLINSTLNMFGFTNFSLDVSDEGTHYKILRADGANAQNTLSEGEKNFIAFLYFYHLLKGSHSEKGILNDKIAVFDDPISSLDNNVLFIVSTLIRELIDAVRSKTSTIKQIFILTHNVYFHKEVTFNIKRNSSSNGKLIEETFWVVRKKDKISYIENKNYNPIKTSYELLWQELNAATSDSLTVCNTMRRILENYFKILGGQDPNKLYEKFEGDEKLICKSLCSWINDGSHHGVFSDENYTITDEDVDMFKKIFKKIFEITNHIEHYNMMMNDRGMINE